MSMPTAVERLRDAINSHDPGRVAGCFSTDYRCERPMRPSEGFTGSDQVLRNWTGVFGSMPDLRADVLRAAVNGPEVWSEWEMNGTGPEGPNVIRGVVVFTVRDDRIDWSRFYLDPVLEKS